MYRHPLEDAIEAARRSGATSLVVPGRSAGSLPESLGSLTNLTELFIGGNRLTELPSWLARLTGLTRLGLSGNQLTEVPSWLGDLTGLTWLDLANNRLSALPASLGRLTALTRLDLTGNQLTSLPSSLGSLTSLTRLYLTENRLTTLPSSLAGMSALTRLDVAGNPFASPPVWLLERASPVSLTPVQAWVDGTATLVESPAGLDAVLSRDVSLVKDDAMLYVMLAGDHSSLVWEDADDIMLSWGPVPPGAPGGLCASDAAYAFSDPWYTAEGAEPFEISEELARAAGHEFLRTARRPANVQWVDKP